MTRILYLTILFTLALSLSLGTAPATITPRAGCQDIGESPDVIAGPLSQAYGWAPSCVIIQDGASVRWTVTDTVAHGVYIYGCYDSDVLVLSNQTAVAFTLGGDGTVLVRSAPSLTPHRCDAFDPDGNVIIAPVDGGVQITYLCTVHPLTMIGKIQIRAR